MKKICLLSIMLLSSYFLFSQEWNFVETGPFGGSATDIFVENDTTLYASFGHANYFKQGGGIYKTTNSGETWEVLNKGLDNTNASTVFKNDTVLFAGFMAEYENADAGVYRSFDDGQSWELSGFSSNTVSSFYKKGDTLFCAHTGGLYITLDNGTNWINFSSGLSSGNSSLYVGGFFESSSDFFIATGGGPYKWSTVSNSWVAANTGFGNIIAKGTASIIEKGDTLFAGSTFNTGPAAGAYYSLNNGSNWTIITSYSGIGKGIYKMYLDDNTIYFISMNDKKLYKTTDNFQTYELVLDHMGLVNMASTTDAFYCGSQKNGIYKSTDNASSWFLSNTGINALRINSFDKNASYYFIGADHNGVFRSSDGINWEQANNGIDNIVPSGFNFGISSLKCAGNAIFGTTSGGSTYYSKDNGDNWQIIDSIMSGSYAIGKGDTILIGSYGNNPDIWKTIDNGQNWYRTGFCTEELEYFSSFAELNENVYAVKSGVLYKSMDWGETWVTIPGTPAGMARIFVSDNSIYCSSGAYEILYRSSDYGQTWENTTFMYDDWYDIQHNYTVANKLFVEYNENVFVCLNHSNNWTQLNTDIIDANPLSASLSSHTIFSIGSRLYASTSFGPLAYTDLNLIEVPTLSEITGPAQVCQNSDVYFSVEEFPNTTYNWIVPSGWVISSGQGSDSILVTVGTSAGSIIVTPTNNYGTGDPQAIYATVNQSPTAEFSADITTILVNETITLTDASTNATAWLWTITPSDGVTFVNGTDETSQNPQVTFANEGMYDVELVVSNYCGDNSEIKNNYITINAFETGTTTATNSEICIGSETGNISLSGYEGTINSWQKNLNDGEWINIEFTSNVYNETPTEAGVWTYRAQLQNGVNTGFSASVSITVNPLPEQPSIISGSTEPITGSTQTYSVVNIESVTYTWSVPSDWTIIAGNTTNSIVVTVGTQSGSIEVVPSNDCGNGEAQTLVVVITSNSELFDSEFIIYPNPAISTISVETNFYDINTQVEILTLTGQIVYVGLLEENKEINIENFNSGLYFVKITNNIGVFTKKIIKK